MYARFFGLERDAFSIAPDPRYLFMSERHREALAHLLYGLDGGGGFVLLTGEIGTGKTTVCRCFLEQVPPNCNVAYLFNPRLNALELLQSICDEFGVIPSAGAASVGAATSLRDCIDALNRFLLDAHAQGRNSVLVVDEAQNLSAEVLEQLRLLTNLETSEKKLLQIVLIGQPELREMLARPELEQLAQRVIARYHLGPLAAAETEHYVQHRMAVAGLVGPLPFEPAALRRIYALTGGVPRRINLLAGRALLGAYALGAHRVDRRIVARAAREVFVPSRKKRRRSIALGLAVPRNATSASTANEAGPSRIAGLPMAAAMLLGVIVAIAVISRTGLPEFLRGTWQAPTAAKIAGFVGMHRDIEAVPNPSALVNGAKAATSEVGATGTPGASAEPDAASGNMSAGAGFTSSASPAAAAPVNADSFAIFAAALPVSEDDAWQALAALWRADVPPLQDQAVAGSPACQALSQSGLRCLQMPRAALSMLQQLDRPGIIALRRGSATLGGDREALGYALLTGLDERSATLVAPDDLKSVVVVPLDLLATRWRGAFDTLWRAAPGDEQSGAADRAALARQLTALQQLKDSGEPGKALEASSATAGSKESPVLDQHDVIYRFQLAHGLTPDGLAGPLTRMQLNRATHVAEPRLTHNAAR
jgi:general secretion pathway protein A